eukprot:GHUV01024549.1.p1 GENE.GHUV01024549.1~~GHUV01024549.1.p1  ORF type:complete len:253 (+),score=76.83 GHUV01024549.1:193-951(+)
MSAIRGSTAKYAVAGSPGMLLVCHHAVWRATKLAMHQRIACQDHRSRGPQHCSCDAVHLGATDAMFRIASAFVARVLKQLLARLKHHGYLGLSTAAWGRRVAATCCNGAQKYISSQCSVDALAVFAETDGMLACVTGFGVHGTSCVLYPLQELAGAVQQQSEQLSAVAQQLLLTVVQKHKQQQQHQPELQQDDGIPASTIALLAGLCHKYRTAAASIIMSTAPFSLPGEKQCTVRLRNMLAAVLYRACGVLL